MRRRTEASRECQVLIPGSMVTHGLLVDQDSAPGATSE